MKKQQRKQKNISRNSRQDGSNTVRIRGVAQDTWTPTLASGFQVQAFNIGVDPSIAISARVAAIAPTFAEWRIRSFRTKIQPGYTFSGATVPEVKYPTFWAGIETDPDSTAPTTLEQVVDNGGEMGRMNNPFSVNYPESASQWLKTTVGIVNTDIRFYVPATLYVATDEVLTADTFAGPVQLLHFYDFEFRNPK